MIAGLKSNDMAFGAKIGAEHTTHQEKTELAQVFLEKVEKFSKAIQDVGNPFQEENQDLYVDLHYFDTRRVSLSLRVCN